MQLTVKARLRDEKIFPILAEMAAEYSSVKRKLFAEVSKEKKTRAELKREFIAKYEITARQFNSMRCEVSANISSVVELKKVRTAHLKTKIDSLKERLDNTLSAFKIHQWKRKLSTLELKLKRTEESLKKTPTICFGGKKLFRKQFNLKENGYKTHEDWKKDWTAARNSQFFLIGSKDESFGNQSCQMLPGRLNLRLTQKLAKKYHSKILSVACEFTYQNELINAALAQGQAMSYRFIYENDRWYVLLSTEAAEAKQVTDFKNGAIGIDLNPACLAMTQISNDGNLVRSWQIPIVIQGRTQAQIEATLGAEIAKIVEEAAASGLPIVIEDLDFSKKKSEMNTRGMNRMLSNFAYSQFEKMIRSKCYRTGVELVVVNPAFTSVIGKHKFSLGYGLSSHCAAAMAIARRGFRHPESSKKNLNKKSNQGFSERLRMKAKSAFDLPVRIRKIRNDSKHVWSDWGRLSKMAQMIDRENYRSLGRQRPERTSGEFISSVLFRMESKPPRKVRKNEAKSNRSSPHVSREDRLPGDDRLFTSL